MENNLHSSVIELSMKALKNNLTFLKQQIGENIIFSSVVKGNAYGHGIEQYVPMAFKCGIKHFSVYSSDEAERVHKILKNKATIMVMGMIESDEALKWAIENDIEFFVFDFERLEKATEIAKALNKKAIIHLELETGMNRTGFEAKHLSKVAGFISQQQEHIRFKGLCTHFAGAENIANFVRIEKQKENFHKLKEILLDFGLKPEINHTSCSAAVIRYPEMNLDMVRIGILQFGLWPSVETFIEFIKDKESKQDPLKRLITWKSKIMNTKEVKTGEFIGYGTSYLAQEDMKVALIPVGYAHGYSRSLSNHGRVLIKGKLVSIIGIVNMNALMIDITNYPGIKKGDEAILIGTDGKKAISIASFSEMSNQLNYEMLTRLPLNIPRMVKN
ncbi:MAG: alanine racemase [Bacteroidetes bacterium]|nr:alanine racemase [Bacteroidota bacterium]